MKLQIFLLVAISFWVFSVGGAWFEVSSNFGFWQRVKGRDDSTFLSRSDFLLDWIKEIGWKEFLPLDGEKRGEKKSIWVRGIFQRSTAKGLDFSDWSGFNSGRDFWVPRSRALETLFWVSFPDSNLKAQLERRVPRAIPIFPDFFSSSSEPDLMTRKIVFLLSATFYPCSLRKSISLALIFFVSEASSLDILKKNII